MNQDSDEDALFSAYLLDKQKSLVFYFTLIVINTGFILNICIVAVFVRKTFANNPMAAYNICIAFTGNIATIVLYFSFFPRAYGLQLDTYSDLSCKCITYASRVFNQMISWLHVMMSLDRMISIVNPALHLIVKTRRFITLACLFVFVCLLLVNIPNVLFRITKNAYNAQAHCTSDKATTRARDMIRIIMRTLLPFALILAANSVVIVNLFRQKRKLSHKRTMRKKISFSVSVVAQNLLFILFMVPQTVVIIYQYKVAFHPDSQNNTPLFTLRNQALINLGITCAAALSTYTICSSFLVNVIFNKIFRKHLTILAKRFTSIFANKNRTNRRSSHHRSIRARTIQPNTNEFGLI